MNNQETLNRELLSAAQKGNAQAVLIALQNGADIEAKDASGMTALISAARYGYTDMARICWQPAQIARQKIMKAVRPCCGLHMWRHHYRSTFIGTWRGD